MSFPGELQAGIPHRLDQYVQRVVAPNGGVLTGAGTNTYLLGGSELMVVDPGPDDSAHLEAILAATAGRPVRYILCTHTHEDHAPGASRLRDLTGAPVCAMRAPATDHDWPLHPDRVLQDAESLGCAGLSLQAVHTPGHASNHLCFLLQVNGMLFTGDHIMQGSTVVIWPPDGDMRAYLRSLRRLLDLPLRSLAPGHGLPISEPDREIRRLIEHRLRREDKVRRAVRTAADSSLAALLPRVYEDVPQHLHAFASLSLQAHLHKLVQDGELHYADGRYRSASSPPA